jgi:hypothetical protein
VTTTNVPLLHACPTANQNGWPYPTGHVKAALGARIDGLPDGMSWSCSSRNGVPTEILVIPRSADFPDVHARLTAFAHTVAALTDDGRCGPAQEPVYEAGLPVTHVPSSEALEALGSVDGVDVRIWAYHPEVSQDDAIAIVNTAVAALRHRSL